jgi:hypothetical protein
MTRLTLETHILQCSTCKIDFESRDRNQLACSRNGRNVFCCVDCRVAKEKELQRSRPGRHVCGPCPTCGEEFRSRIKGKTFCSMKCYTSHPTFLERLRRQNEEKSKAAFPDGRPCCPQCGEETPKNRKYCNNLCRRKYFAERFDRFVANPEQIALPQNFDEFLLQSELPCLFEGCEWCGTNLSVHVNTAHGVPVEKFKELVGFNRTTGLVAPSLSEFRSNLMKKLIKEGVCVPDPKNLEKSDRSVRPEMRLEGKEHWQKSMAIRGGMEKFAEAGAAKSREPQRRKEISKRMKQTLAEMPMVPKVCEECGCDYEVKQMHIDKAKFCSQKCRNACNNRKRRQSSS